MLALFHTFPSPVRDKDNKKVPQEELRIPTLAKSPPSNLQRLSPLLALDQAMVNDISRHLVEGESRVPKYTPCVIAQFHLGPWKSPLPSHDRVVDGWADRANALRSPHPLPFQAYLFYQLRFIMAGHLFSACEAFGGLSAQYDDLAIMLNLPVVGQSGVDIDYDLLRRRHIAQLSRQRHAEIDFTALLS